MEETEKWENLPLEEKVERLYLEIAIIGEGLESLDRYIREVMTKDVERLVGKFIGENKYLDEYVSHLKQDISDLKKELEGYRKNDQRTSKK